jgi:hypothetical protein
MPRACGVRREIIGATIVGVLLGTAIGVVGFSLR